ncbi:MAG TPA: hypothetical protein VN025_08595 [Candidatus Dormibacteraeota bacterium]|jgi:hypothetical protein|nr:hypothetical protein [Candidatus Dormibacteraeota bacterium]
MPTKWVISFAVFSLLVPSAVHSVVTDPGESQFTIFGISIGMDTLKTVQEKLGPSKPCVVSEHLTTLGYKVGNETLIFESSDIGGGDITGLVLRESRERPLCELSTPINGNLVLKTDGGVRVGMTRGEFTKIFGRAQKTSGNGIWTYKWLRTEKLQRAAQSPPGGSDNTVDILVTVEARFSSRGLTYFYISRIKSL